MYIASLWRQTAPMGLNRVSEEGNLTASDECPATYVSLSHTQVDISIIMQESGQTHLRQGQARASGGLRLFHLPRLGAEYERKVCEWPVVNEASFGASRHPGPLLSGVPSADVNNKRQSGIIRPLDAQGVRRFNHVCVMNAAAVSHCLFIMSPNAVVMWY